jgi:hypothetical protein
MFIVLKYIKLCCDSQFCLVQLLPLFSYPVAVSYKDSRLLGRMLGVSIVMTCHILRLQMEVSVLKIWKVANIVRKCLKGPHAWMDVLDK